MPSKKELKTSILKALTFVICSILLKPDAAYHRYVLIFFLAFIMIFTVDYFFTWGKKET